MDGSAEDYDVQREAQGEQDKNGLVQVGHAQYQLCRSVVQHAILGVRFSIALPDGYCHR
jgi:hypothetical protein